MPESEATLAVVVARLDDLRQDVAGLRNELHASQSENVSRGEWGQRNAHVDTRLDALGREIGDLRTEVRSARAPWWTWATVLCAVAGVLLAVFLP